MNLADIQRSINCTTSTTHTLKAVDSMVTTVTATKESPVLDHQRDQAYNKQGFGSKIPTDKMVQINGGKRWHRVYSSFQRNYDPNGIYNYSYIIRNGRQVRL